MQGDVPAKQDPVTLASLAGRVSTLESALATLIEELTALRADVQRLSKTKATPPKNARSKVEAKPTAAPKPPKKERRTPVLPWDDPEILTALEASRPQILKLLGDGNSRKNRERYTANHIADKRSARGIR